MTSLSNLGAKCENSRFNNSLHTSARETDQGLTTVAPAISIRATPDVTREFWEDWKLIRTGDSVGFRAAKLPLLHLQLGLQHFQHTDFQIAGGPQRQARSGSDWTC